MTTARVYVFAQRSGFLRHRKLTTVALVQCITGSWGLWLTTHRVGGQA